MMEEDPGYSEKKKFKGEAVASDADIAAVGGEKTLTIQNIFFQADIDAQAKADSLLARLKDKKEYFETTIEFCLVPVERRDTVAVEEYIKHDKSVYHLGLIRHVRLEVTPSNQTLTLMLEE